MNSDVSVTAFAVRCVIPVVLMWILAVDVRAFDFGSIDIGKVVDIARQSSSALGEISEEEEIRIGAEISSRLLGAAHLVDEPELQAYVNKVGRWLAMQTERPDLPWHFGVVDTGNCQCLRRSRWLYLHHQRPVRIAQ